MIRHLLLWAALMPTAALAEPLHFGGDPIAGPFPFTIGSSISTGRDWVYDDFLLTSNSNVSGFIADVYTQGPPTGLLARYEIRSSVAPGFGGDIVALGENLSVSTTPLTTGIPSTRPFYRCRVDGLNIFLTPERYWLALYFNDVVELAQTNGLNGVGGAVGNGNAYLTSPFYSANFLPLVSPPGFPNPDFCYGVEGAPVPEPSAMIVLFGSSLWLVRRRKSR